MTSNDNGSGSSGVHQFPLSNSLTPEQALSAALKVDLKDVLIVGISAGDELFALSSRMTRRDALWLIEVSKKHTLGL